MEEEIDLRPYIEAVIRSWKWIIGAAILAAVIAFAITFFIPPTYEATALVAVTEPRQVVEFDPRIKVADDELPFDAYPELATSDELLVSLLNEVESATSDITNLKSLRGILSAKAGADPSLLNLSVQNGDPVLAAEIVNKWAELFVVKANDVFGSQGDDQLLFFEEQLENSSEELQQAEDALVEYQTRNRSMILENELLALQQTQADQLAKRRQITLLLQDAAGLQAQLSRTGNNSDLSSADQLAAILLQLRTFSGVPTADAAVPWQLQVNMEQFSTAGKTEQVDFLSGLQDILSEQAEQIDAHLLELEPLIFVVQQEKQEADSEANSLARNVKVAEDTYTALAHKVQEEHITSQDTNSGVRLASRSAIPSTPESSGRWIIMLIATVLGTTIAIVVIIARAWGKEPAQS